MKNKTQSSIFF